MKNKPDNTRAFMIWLFTVACITFTLWLGLTGCKSVATTTIEWKPIERKEVSPYIEVVMNQLSDSCRLILIENVDGKSYYKLECKKGAKELRNYLIKK